MPAYIKLFSKIVMMESSLSIFAGNPERNLAPASVKRNSAGNVASGVFKMRKAIDLAVSRSVVY